MALYDPYDGRLIKYLSKVDLQLDAAALALKPASVGVLVASNLPNNLTGNFFQEAFKALEPGGLLLFHGGEKRDFFDASIFGLTPVQYRQERNTHGQEKWHIVLKKPELKASRAPDRNKLFQSMSRAMPRVITRARSLVRR